MDEEDDGFDSFDDENLDELLNLKSKNSNNIQIREAKVPTNKDVESLLQSAQGENAILRSKLELLEAQKTQDIQRLKEQFNNDLHDKVSKIQAYQDLLVKLEDEKRFLKSELNSLSTRTKPVKKRKLNDARETSGTSNENDASMVAGDEDVVMAQDTTATTAITTTTATTTQSHTQQQTPPPAQIKVIHHQSAPLPNEKQLFIETIYNHVINGASNTTLNYLARISSPFDFKHENFKVESNNSISTSVMNYLIQLNNNVRLDNLISEFIEIMTIYIQKLYLNNSLLPIPFLLSFVHCSLNYRPSALHNDIIEQLLQFNSDFLKSYLHLLKPTTGQGAQQQQVQEKKKSLQYTVLDQFIVLFSLDIVELLSKLSYTKQDTIKLYWKLLPKEIIKASLSTSTCINFVFNMVEIMTYSITSFLEEQAELDEEDEDSFVKDDDILLSMTKLLVDGMPLTKGLRVYGQNRLIGNNDDFSLLEKLIPKAKTASKPLPISQEDISEITLQNKLKHELQTLNVKLKILRFFEIFLMNNPISVLKLEVIIELLKIFIWVLLKEQEYLIRNPRSETVALRNSMINTIVKLLHFIILRNDEIPQDLILQKLSNDISYNFIIALSRISFSSDTNLTAATTDFLKKIDRNFEIPIFNRSVEFTNYLQNNISILDAPMGVKIQSILGSNNGLEINFDDDIIEMSRDLIELYTTAIEADNLYFAMNRVVESNEIDELMMEYMNDNNKR